MCNSHHRTGQSALESQNQSSAESRPGRDLLHHRNHHPLRHHPRCHGEQSQPTTRSNLVVPVELRGANSLYVAALQKPTYPSRPIKTHRAQKQSWSPASPPPAPSSPDPKARPVNIASLMKQPESTPRPPPAGFSSSTKPSENPPSSPKPPPRRVAVAAAVPSGYDPYRSSPAKTIGLRFRRGRSRGSIIMSRRMGARSIYSRWIGYM